MPTKYIVCVCGLHIALSLDVHYQFCWDGVLGSNSRAEVIALWGLLYYVMGFHIDSMYVFGDS